MDQWTNEWTNEWTNGPNNFVRRYDEELGRRVATGEERTAAAMKAAGEAASIAEAARVEAANATSTSAATSVQDFIVKAAEEAAAARGLLTPGGG